MFVKSVAKNRGTSQAAVRDGYGQGRSLLATDAVKQNLADRVGTFDDVLGEALGRRQIGSGAAAASSRGGRILGSAARPEDDEEDQGECKCECAACQSCENKTGESAARSDDLSCQCPCDACKACTYKSGAAARNPSVLMRRRQLELDSASVGSDYRASLRRRQREIDIAK
jgi:ClpP class serine protease